MILNFLYLAVIHLFFNAAILDAQPRLEVDGGNIFNLGTLSGELDIITFNVILSNTGTDTLKIHEVKPKCGCMTSPLKNNTIEPGGKTKLEITLRITKDNGQYDKDILFITNMPEPHFNLTVKSEITSNLNIKPAFLYIKSSENDSISFGDIEISNNTMHNMTLYDFETKPGEITINKIGRTVLKPNESMIIKAKLSKKSGFSHGFLHFKTDNWQTPNVQIRVISNQRR